MKKTLALVLALVLALSIFVGCDKEKTGEGTGEISDVAVNELADTVEDSSELPDWTGKKIELTKWYASGSYSLYRNNISTNNVVEPEVFRVTGVKFSEDSYDNNGDTMDAKMAKIAATNDWPEVIHGGQGDAIAKLIEQDMLWDLTDLIPKYMPHLDALMKKGNFMKSKREDGKIYEIDLQPALEYAYPDTPQEILAISKHPKSDCGDVLIRDDILKMLKPEAYTQAELVEIFEANGTFTEEEVLNASFSSKEEFYQFMRDIKALGLKAGNREVYATYALAGSDNWDFLSVFAGALNGFNATGSASCNYFTYYDVETGRVEYMFEQPFFKEIMRELTQLIQEDVISEDSLLDSRATFEEKCASGQYAILYGGTAPDVNTLNKNADGYQYRKVIINIPWNTDKFLPASNPNSGGYEYAFLKNEIAEEDLPQILRFFDFMLTDVGQKLQMWGPKSAGLFEETENGRRFTNKEVEAEAVYGESNDSLIKYGLSYKPWPGVPFTVNRWDPLYIYDFVPTISLLNKFYSPGLHRPFETVPSIGANFYSFAEGVKGAGKGWSARTAFENALTKIMTAKDDAEFESLYDSFLAIARQNSYNEETLEAINIEWVTNVNKDNMEYVKEYLEKRGKKLNIDVK